MFQRTLVCFRRATVTIPRLSPTHSKAKILNWSVEAISSKNVTVECYDPVFVLQCSPDLISEGYRRHDTDEPLMIVEAHDEGSLSIKDDVELNRWYDVGTEIGVIDDGDNEDAAYDGEWIWQAYGHDEPEAKSEN